MAYKDYDLLFKVIIIGDSGVGKSCLLNRYVDEVYVDTYISTIGVDFKIKTIDLDGKTIKLQIWDTAGQERFRSITTTYYRGTHAIVLVFDLTSVDSFNNLDNWLNQVKNHMQTNHFILLVGTKSDKIKDTDMKNIVKRSDIDEFCKDRDIKYFETSASKGTGITEMFNELCRGAMTTCLNENPRNSNRPILYMDASEIPNKKKCC